MGQDFIRLRFKVSSLFSASICVFVLRVSPNPGTGPDTAVLDELNLLRRGCMEGMLLEDDACELIK